MRGSDSLPKVGEQQGQADGGCGDDGRRELNDAKKGLRVVTTGPGTSVALYLRVSSDEQAAAGTIENQLQFLRRYCELHEYVIKGEYRDEGVSGVVRFEERPEGKRFLADAQAEKFSVLLVYRLDRFSRKVLYLLQSEELLNTLGVGLASATEPFDTRTPIGRTVLIILGSFAELERETILERTWMGRERVASQGKVPGGTPPLGYRFEKGVIVLCEQEAKLVHRIFELYAQDRLGLEAIANRLNSDGVLPAKWLWGKGEKGYKGRPSRSTWTAPRIADILKNTTYRGEYHYGKMAIACPAIIEDALWDAVQRQREQNQLLAGRNTKHRTYLLKGLIRCGYCGRRYAGSGSRTRPFGYSCPNRKPPDRCPGRSVAAVPLEEAIWRDVSSFAHDPGPVMDDLANALQGGVEREQPLEESLQAVQRAIGGLDLEKQRLVTIYRKGRLDDDELDRQLESVAQDGATLEAQREELTAALLTLKERETHLITAEGLLKELSTRIEDADETTKAEVIHGLVNGIVVEPDGSFRVTYCFGPQSAIGSVSSGR